jgi:hypothetical protein
MANLKGGTTIGGQLALNTSNGLALTGGTMKGNTFIPGVYFTRYGPNIDWVRPYKLVETVHLVYQNKSYCICGYH